MILLTSILKILKFIFSLLLIITLSSCSDYLETETDELIASQLDNDIVFITSLANLQCSIPHLKYTQASGLDQLANTLEKTADELKGFDESSIKVKIQLFELAAIAKKAVPLLKDVENMEKNHSDSPNHSLNVLNAIKAVNLERETEFAKKDLEIAMDKLKLAMSDYIKSLKKRAKGIVLEAKKSKLMLLSLLFVDKNKMISYATASFKKSLHREYLKQNSKPENNAECFDGLMQQYVNNHLIGG